MFVPGGLLVQGDKFKRAGDDGDLPGSSAEEQEESSGLKATRKSAKTLRKAERQERKEAKLKKRAEASNPDSVCDVEGKMTDPTHKAAETMQSGERQKSSTQHTDVMHVENALSTDRKQKWRKTAKDKHKSHLDEANDTVKDFKEEKVLIDTVQLPTPPSDDLEVPIFTQAIQSSSRNGRHILRGRNIQAKRMAFADSKMLDEVRRSIPFQRDDC